MRQEITAQQYSKREWNKYESKPLHSNTSCSMSITVPDGPAPLCSGTALTIMQCNPVEFQQMGYRGGGGGGRAKFGMATFGAVRIWHNS